jgi:hypothetical protein
VEEEEVEGWWQVANNVNDLHSCIKSPTQRRTSVVSPG